MTSIKKADLFFDLDTGAVGSFIETKPVVGEQGKVDVWYRPLNSFMKKCVIKAVPKVAISRFSLPILADGSQGTYTIITENSKGQARLLNELKNISLQNNVSLKERLEKEKYNTKIAQQKMREKEQSIDRQQKKAIDRRPRRSFGGDYRFGGGYGGESPHNISDDQYLDGL